MSLSRIDNAILILSSRPHLPTESCPAVSAAAAAVRSFTLQPRTRPEAPRRAVCRFSGILKPEPSTTTDFFFITLAYFLNSPDCLRFGLLCSYTPLFLPRQFPWRFPVCNLTCICARNFQPALPASPRSPLINKSYR